LHPETSVAEMDTMKGAKSGILSGNHKLYIKMEFSFLFNQFSLKFSSKASFFFIK